MLMKHCVLYVALFVFTCAGVGQAEDAFRVTPYLQNPSQDAITIRWLSNANEAGTVTVDKAGGAVQLKSMPEEAKALSYNPFGEEPGGPHPGLPYLHRVRVTGLEPNTEYRYRVQQGTVEHADGFRTAPDANTAVRMIFYSDPETEPESSTSPPVEWPAGKGTTRPAGVTQYLVDQTTGYRENLKVIDSRKPNFISVVGDLVESGGEQRDWDEFWKHNAGTYNTLAGHIPLIAALGNHENYGGPGAFGGYSTKASDFGCGKYLTYFEFPANGAADPHHEGRYYRLDYGPVTLITVDSSDGSPEGTASDTNHNLSGSHAADFNPGSPQYVWLERQLAEAQKQSRFTIVQYHHKAYGSGPHSVPFGKPSFSGQSGIAMRVLQPLFMKYGVDAVISGHDEMLERSLVPGEELLADGTKVPHEIHYYDVGMGGDGLRGATTGAENPFRKFLAHDDAPEVWNGKQLISGGKHYGHLEVNVAPNDKNQWGVTLEFVQVFPITDATGKVTSWERRTYADLVKLQTR